MYSETEGFEDRIGYSRASGRTTRMVEAANKYAREHDDQYVLFIVANHQEKRRLRPLLVDNVHVCTIHDEQYESQSYHVGFWDHFAAENALRNHLKQYDQRVSEMIEYTWWKNEEEE